MTTTSKLQSTLSSGAATPEASGFGGFAHKLSKLVLNRSVAILWWTGLAALMVGFRMATTSGAEGEEMFRAWMIDWAVVWVILAALSLRLLKPIFDYVVSEQNAYAEALMVREISKHEPNFAQELRSMAMQQQMRDEQASESAAQAADALSALGGLTVSRSPKAMKSLHLGARLGSAT
jgi:hypothetical protein